MLVFSASLYAGTTTPEVVTKTEIVCFIPDSHVVAVDFVKVDLAGVDVLMNNARVYILKGLNTRAGPLYTDDNLQSTIESNLESFSPNRHDSYRRARDGLIRLQH